METIKINGTTVSYRRDQRNRSRSVGVSGQVAAAVAQNRELAAQVAILARLKAQTTALRREPERTHLPAGNGRRRWILTACTGTVLATAILTGLVLVPWDTRQTTPAWLQPARMLHAQWLRQGIDGEGPHGAAGAFGVPWVPDLRAIDLRQHTVQRAAAGHAGVVHVGYTGSRGCMLSFLTWPDEHGLSPEPRRFGEGAETAWAWRVGDVGYLLLATRMAPERLAVVVEVVHETTLKRLPPGPDAQRQYLASRRSTAPCQT
jgi:hypothetical protein